MSFFKTVRASQSNLIYLVRGKEKPSQLDAWYYIQLSSKMKESIFLHKIKTGLVLTDFGEILFSGWGKEPPEAIKAKIKETYN